MIRNFFCTLLGISIGAYVALAPVVVSASPAQLTFQGRIVQSGGQPLEHNNVSFLFEITSADGLCTLFREQKDGVNMAGSGGVFDVPIGSGTKLFPADPLKKLADVFINGSTLDCAGGGTWNAPAESERLLKIQFHDGVGWKVIDKPNIIRSVPYAYFAYSAQKLGNLTSNDLVLKSSLPAATCAVGEVLTFNGLEFICVADQGGAGVVSSVGATPPLTVSGTGNVTLGINVGTTAGTVAAGNDARILGSFQSATNLGGDLSGTLPNPVVARIQGKSVSSTAPLDGQVWRYNLGATQWQAVNFGVESLRSSTGLAQFASASCSNNQTLTWSSLTDTFLCANISISESNITGTIAATKISGNISGNASGFSGALSGDVSGTQTATSVDKIKGKVINLSGLLDGQVLKWNQTASEWQPSAAIPSLSNGNIWIGNASNIATPAVVSGDASLNSAGVLSLKATGSAGTYTKVTTDAQGRVTAGTSLSVSDIPGLPWSQITSGKPTTLAGYGVTDGVRNDGATPSLQAGLDAGKPAAGTVGRVYLATDTNKIYRDTGGAWNVLASAVGSGGTVTSVIAGTGLTGGTISTSGTIGLGAELAALNGLATTGFVKRTGAGAYSTASSISLTADVTGTLPIANGGTNSTTALVNNRIMASTGGAIVEAAAITASRALVSDANGIPTHSAVTGSELGYLSGVTSGLQAQINSKAASAGWSNYSVMGVNGSGALTAIPGATVGTHLNWTATGPAWTTATFPASTTVNQLLYSSANNVVGGLATANSSVLLTNASGVPNWGAISADTFSQYALLAGRSGGQTLYGGTAASNKLTLDSTSNATKGSIVLAPSGGNVGVNTASPAEKLHISGGNLRIDNGANAAIYNSGGMVFSGVPGTNVHANYIFRPGWGSSTNTLATILLQNANTSGTYTDCVQLASFGDSFFRCGNVGIGTNSPNAPLDVVGRMRVTNDTSWPTYEIYNSLAPANQRWTELYSDNSGVVVLRNVNDAYTAGATIFHSHRLAGSQAIDYTVWDGKIGIGFAPSYTFHANGSVAGVGAYINASDIRLKKNIQPITNAREKLFKLSGVSFDWRQDEFPKMNFEQTHDLGVIAQEVEKVFPEAVKTAKDGYKSVAYSKLIAPLIEVSKETYGLCEMNSSQIEKLQVMVASLEKENLKFQREVASVKEENSLLKENLQLLMKEQRKMQERMERLEKSNSSR